MVGYTHSTDVEGITSKGMYDAYILKINNEGNLEWQKSYGGISYDYFRGFTTTLYGEYVGVGYTYSTDIEGITNNGSTDGLIVTLHVLYDITCEETTNGSFDAIQEGLRGKITISPDENYELDEIIVTDSKGNRVEYYEEDGEYYFDLNDDVTVNVTFRKETILDIVNPDTGVMQIIDIIVIVGLILGGVFYFKRKKNYV